MKLSLSTNWCNRRLKTGEEIAEKALELGFDELELGFHTPIDQVAGFKRMLDRIPVGSVHAFCPVPISAPCGYPELYSLASFDEDQRALARFHVKRNIEFAADMGAATVVLHAGRVSLSTFFNRSFSSGDLRAALTKVKGDFKHRAYRRMLARAMAVRRERGTALLDVFLREIEALVSVLEKNGVVLALENLPYLEGFPNESEMGRLQTLFRGAPIAAWFDTGHHRVRESHGWVRAHVPGGTIRGLHLNDVVDFHDDHLPPGEGKVDFAALKSLARSVRHVVFEPNAGVPSANLRLAVAYIRELWS